MTSFVRDPRRTITDNDDILWNGDLNLTHNMVNELVAAAGTQCVFDWDVLMGETIYEKYESFYVKPDVLKENAKPNPYRKKAVATGTGKEAVKMAFRTLINGVSVYPPDKILMQLYNKNTGKIVLENVFYYKK